MVNTLDSQTENNAKRLEHVGRLLTGAVVALAIVIVLIVIVLFA